MQLGVSLNPDRQPALVCPPAGTLDHEEMADIAESIARRDPATLVVEGTGRRWRLIATTESYQAWVIVWPAGSGLGMHDHDGSSAAVRVVAGRLRERYRVDATVRTRWIETGDVHHLAADHVHEVINLDDVDAISVHVYSPPMADMDFRTDPEIDLRRAGR